MQMSDKPDHPETKLLDSVQMATFAAQGYLLMENVVPDEINRHFLDDIGYIDDDEIHDWRSYYGRIMGSSGIPFVQPGTPLAEAYSPNSALNRLLKLPVIAGAIESLVGKSPAFDHHFLHITFPEKYHAGEPVSQHWHQDSTIDVREAFDVQLMYFPHDVTREMGGTRYLPGSHLRVVSESAIGRYQNLRGQQHVVCPAGSVLLVHHGIWHGGGVNHSDRCRYMFKIRMCPTERQCRLWDDSDLGNDHFEQRPIFWTRPTSSGGDIHAILMAPQPWYEADTQRLEMINRVRFWRYLLGDMSFDADYWLTRIENDFPRSAEATLEQVHE